MDRQKTIGLSNSLQNLLFPPGKYTINQLLNLTPFFQGNINLQNYKSLMAKTFQMIDEQRLWWIIKAENGEVDGKSLLIVLMLQLIGRQRRQLGGYNQASRNISSSAQMNKLNSPRSKTNRALYISNQQILILNFIKENLVNFLKLLSNQPPNTQDPYLTAQQLQPINILFKVDRTKQFSSYLPIFNNSHKLKASTISDHLTPRISISEQELLSLQGYSLSVQIKQQIQCRGKDVKIIGYYNSQVFIDSSVRSLYIVGCASCTIYVASCQRIAFVDKCQKINLTVTTNLLRICNTQDSNIYFYGPSPIIMTGENRSVILGPNNSTSHELKNHMKTANISINEKYYENFSYILGRSENSSYQIMDPSDYDLLVMPVKNEQQQSEKFSKENQILLAPPKYLKQLEQRNTYYCSFKQKLKTSNLNGEMMKNLHSAYQGHFKEWLIAKGYIKNMNDLVKMIDKK